MVPPLEVYPVTADMAALNILAYSLPIVKAFRRFPPNLPGKCFRYLILLYSIFYLFYAPWFYGFTMKASRAFIDGGVTDGRFSILVGFAVDPLVQHCVINSE